MRTRAAAACSHVADDLAPLHLFTRTDSKTREVPIERLDSMAVIDQDLPPVSAGQAGSENNSIRRGAYSLSEARRDIDARMERAFTVERVLALPEGARNRSNHRPKRWRIRQIHPVVAIQRGQAAIKGPGKAT